MLMHFTDLAIANRWLLYSKYFTVCGTPKKNTMSFLEFCVEMAILGQHDNDNSDDQGILVQGKKHPVKAVSHVSVHKKANAHLPEVVNLKNTASCRVLKSLVH